ncbi:hypothetical protein KI387_024866, partial [Taxus chinensis]
KEISYKFTNVEKGTGQSFQGHDKTQGHDRFGNHSTGDHRLDDRGNGPMGS